MTAPSTLKARAVPWSLTRSAVHHPHVPISLCIPCVPVVTRLAIRLRQHPIRNSLCLRFFAPFLGKSSISASSDCHPCPARVIHTAARGPYKHSTIRARKEHAMQSRALCTLAAALLVASASQMSSAADDWGLKSGKVELKSIGPMTLGPHGIFFVGDPAAATVYAIATDDKAGAPDKVKLNLDKIDTKLAEALGTSQVRINDLAVHPASGNVYIAASVTEPKQNVLVRVDGEGQISRVSLDNVPFASATLAAAPGEQSSPGRRGNPRDQSITDLAFMNGKLVVSGVEGSDALSAVYELPFPFAKDAKFTDVAIYHASHGRVEDSAPVRTFAPFVIDGQPVLLAGFTCTPLVMFPLNRLEAGKKVRGTTVAELGSRNSPLDMLVYQKDGQDFVLMSNTARGVMKISTAKIEANAGLSEPVRGGGTAGQPFETIRELAGVVQFDRLGDDHLMVLAKADDGALTLKTALLP